MSSLGTLDGAKVKRNARPGVRIRPAENGYIIERDGTMDAVGNWQEYEPYICNNETEAAEAVKAILTGFHPLAA